MSENELKRDVVAMLGYPPGIALVGPAEMIERDGKWYVSQTYVQTRKSRWVCLVQEAEGKSDGKRD